MNALFLHCETKGIRHCRFGFVYLNDEIIEDGQPIKGAILMLVPQGDGSKVYREVMSEISGALAEKDQIITYLTKTEMQLRQNLKQALVTITKIK